MYIELFQRLPACHLDRMLVDRFWEVYSHLYWQDCGSTRVVHTDGHYDLQVFNSICITELAGLTNHLSSALS